MYDTQHRKLTDWTKQATEKGLPSEWTKTPNKVVNISFSPEDNDLMLLQDHEMFTVIDLKKVCIVWIFIK